MALGRLSKAVPLLISGQIRLTTHERHSGCLLNVLDDAHFVHCLPQLQLYGKPMMLWSVHVAARAFIGGITRARWCMIPVFPDAQQSPIDCPSMIQFCTFCFLVIIFCLPSFCYHLLVVFATTTQLQWTKSSKLESPSSFTLSADLQQAPSAIPIATLQQASSDILIELLYSCNHSSKQHVSSDVDKVSCAMFLLNTCNTCNHSSKHVSSDAHKLSCACNHISNHASSDADKLSCACNHSSKHVSSDAHKLSCGCS